MRARPYPGPGLPFPTRREELPPSRERRPLPHRPAGRDAHRIDTAREPSPAAARCAAATLAVVITGVVFLLAWLAEGHRAPDEQGWLESLATMVSYGVAGAVLIHRRPDLPFGWLLAGAAVLIVVQVVAVLPAYEAAGRGADGFLIRCGLAATSFGFLPIAVQGLINVRFPAGRPATWRGRVLEIALVTGTVLVVVGGIVVAVTAEELGGLEPRGAAGEALMVLAPGVVLLGLVAGLGVVVRYLRARGVERQQLKWRAAGILAALALFPLAVTDHLGGFNALDPVLFVLTLAVPVLRYRLWAIDTIVARSAVYASVTALLVCAYLGVSALLVRLTADRLAAPVAAAAVALLFAPVRARVQRLVERLFYGDRSDPYRTLRELGRRLNAVPQRDVLASLVESAATSLRLPYVAIERADGAVLAGTGSPGPLVRRWPLRYEQRVEGFLAAGPRRGEDGFDDRDAALLDDVASQLGVAVHAAGLTAELLRSRERLVTAREEERRRLRRDLHDGIGPVLTAVGLTLDAAAARLDADPAGAARYVGEAREATTQALAELRRLVHGLRPPALDELGLVGALRSQADRLRAGTGPTVTVTAGDLPELPAAVEVAVFRIAVEAVTNTVRHSDAAHCRVRVAVRERDLVLEVGDDGTTGRPWQPGVGLTAMRERAEELGGTLHAGPAPAGGASVTARFPLPPPSDDLLIPPGNAPPIPHGGAASDPRSGVAPLPRSGAVAADTTGTEKAVAS
ncbi:sensor histidine kinase [Dactylosporangium siamense]|uniref:sensor histidine kinase n=1 Tax=Dactylosporangium siamense TaxID=685454 RepID=UPI001940B964|nr:sensor histidine kinase [Dactylosporangium siamense]